MLHAKCVKRLKIVFFNFLSHTTECLQCAIIRAHKIYIYFLFKFNDTKFKIPEVRLSRSSCSQGWNSDTADIIHLPDTCSASLWDCQTQSAEMGMSQNTKAGGDAVLFIIAFICEYPSSSLHAQLLPDREIWMQHGHAAANIHKSIWSIC